MEINLDDASLEIPEQEKKYLLRQAKTQKRATPKTKNQAPIKFRKWRNEMKTVFGELKELFEVIYDKECDQMDTLMLGSLIAKYGGKAVEDSLCAMTSEEAKEEYLDLCKETRIRQ